MKIRSLGASFCVIDHVHVDAIVNMGLHQTVGVAQVYAEVETIRVVSHHRLEVVHEGQLRENHAQRRIGANRLRERGREVRRIAGAGSRASARGTFFSLE